MLVIIPTVTTNTALPNSNGSPSCFPLSSHGEQGSIAPLMRSGNGVVQYKAILRIKESLLKFEAHACRPHS